MHQDEVWEKLLPNGEPSLDGAIDSIAIVWFYRFGAAGVELLFQRRSATIDKYAGKWDVSAGGHVNHGEQTILAALRETREEIGVSLQSDELQYGFTYCRGNQIATIYFYHCQDHDKKFTFNDAEVDATEWVPLENLSKFRAEFCKEPLAQDELQFQLINDWLRQYADHRN